MDTTTVTALGGIAVVGFIVLLAMGLAPLTILGAFGTVALVFGAAHLVTGGTGGV
jgi:hypothetical protein